MAKKEEAPFQPGSHPPSVPAEAARALGEKLKEVEFPPEQLNSVEITRSAKGDLSFKVKAYGEHVADAGVRARAEFAEMAHWTKEKPQG